MVGGGWLLLQNGPNGLIFAAFRLEFAEFGDCFVVRPFDGGFIAAEIVEGLGVGVEGCRHGFVGVGWEHFDATALDRFRGGLEVGHEGLEAGGFDAAGAFEAPGLLADLVYQRGLLIGGWFPVGEHFGAELFEGGGVFAGDYYALGG